MSEKKRSRRRKDEYTGPGEQEVEKPSKDEYKVAKWLKSNVKTKKTKFLSHNVEYFTANKALDAIMKSKFAEGEKALFPSREHAIEFLDIMLEHKFFHRAKKVPVYPEELKGKSKNKDIKESATTSKKESKEEKNVEKTDVDSNAEGAAPISTEESTQLKEKRKRKIRLDMHPEQVFVDASEAYVWIYDPIPLHYWIIGLSLLLGAIVICLFPLWPPMLRKGVYYLSVAAAGFLVFILALTVVRLIIFVLVWILTAGKLHLWIFPNLTEDVGFLASFWPLYETKYDTDKNKPEKKSRKKKKDKDSDNEDIGDVPPLEPEKIEDIKEHDADVLVRRRDVPSESGDTSENCQENVHSDAKESTTQSESESEGSRSSTGKDFEMVDPNDVDT